MPTKQKIAEAFSWSAALVAVFVAAVTVTADLKPALKTWLADTFTHHWIGKGVLAAVLFAVLGVLWLLLPISTGPDRLRKNLSLLLAASWLAALAIIGFYFYEAFLAH